MIAQLTQQYTANYQKSSAVESRLWHAVFDLVKAFIAAYTAALKAGYPRAEQKRWRAILPWVLVRLAHYEGLDGKFRLFRYSHWIPAQWREFHELYEFARMRGWQREQLVFGVGAFAKPGVSLEQEYLKTLMLMRLDSGNFTPDQVEWVAHQLEDWTPSLTLVPPPGDGAGFFVDLTGSQGLRRRDKPHSGGRVMLLDTGPVYTRVVERMRWLPEQDEELPKPGDLPPREQRLLLMRLAALFGPDAIAQAPRAARFRTDGDVRVVVGLQALTRAIAEIDRLPEQRAHAGRRGELRRGHADGEPDRQSRDRSRGASAAPSGRWSIAATPAAGCSRRRRTRRAKLGEILAIKDGEHWRSRSCAGCSASRSTRSRSASRSSPSGSCAC